MRGRRRAALAGLCAIVAVALSVLPAATALGSRLSPSGKPVSLGMYRGAPSDVYLVEDFAWYVDGDEHHLRSTDYGVSWTTVPGLPPGTGDFVACPSGRVLFGALHGGVFASNDRGDTWENLLAPVGNPLYFFLMDVDVAASNEQIIYARVQWAVTVTDWISPTVWRHAVFTSTDGGASWYRADLNFAEPNPQTGEAEVVVSPDGRGALINSHYGVFRTTDFGRSWAPVDVQWGTTHDLAYDPSSPGVIYSIGSVYQGEGTLGLSSLYRSVNGGATWHVSYSPTPYMEGEWRVTWSPRGVFVTDRGVVLMSSEETRERVERAPVSSTRIERSTDGGTTFDEYVDGASALDVDHWELSLYVTGWQSGFQRVWLGESTLLYGTDRYGTAAEVSCAFYPEPGTAGGVVVTTARNFPDAMAAGPLAHAVDGPILLADPVTGMPTWLADEADRACSDTATAYLIGGVDVVPASVAADLAARGFEVVRISGPTRYETAVAVAEELEDPTRVVIATGEDFPDALTASAPAAKMGAPVLFSFGESLRPAVREYLEANPDISRAYVIGGDDVVSAAVEDELEDLVGETVRLAGTTRYDTSRAVADRFWGNGADFAAIASGADFPDALSGAVLAARQDGPLLIATPDELSWPTSDWLTDHDPDDVFFIGGPDVVSGAPAYEYEALR